MEIKIIGGGLAGCEAAYKCASLGIPVQLHEMRPLRQTKAHQTGYLAELVCSNSLKSEDPITAQGLLKQEMRTLGSLILHCADQCRVPAGGALAVDRLAMAAMVTEIISAHPLIELVREEVIELPDCGVVIVASGPLTSELLANSMQKLTGQEHLYFFDAIAPSIAADSVDMSKVYRASRYGKGEQDYLNCPLNEEQYNLFYDELVKADVSNLNEVDQGLYFSACMPIEEIAGKGRDTLRFGPMRPVGLPHPNTGKLPYAVVQLRVENLEGTMLSLVGFQTRLKWGEQERVLRLIPGLEKAVFLRLGAMHRNTFINSPLLLNSTLEFKTRPGLFFAGQMTGVEGYMESAATGILAGLNAALTVRGQTPVFLPETTMLGSLTRYLAEGQTRNFQPMNANFGLLPALAEKIRSKKARNQGLVKRSREELFQFSEGLSNVIVRNFSL